MATLAVKYRPETFSDVVGQGVTSVILQRQISTGTHKNAYLFCGGSGTGKTTLARIFDREINGGKSTAIEIDAASNNGVDNIREIKEVAQRSSITARYKVFILDECHQLSAAAWAAFLKLLEEPPASSIFVLCTTDPQKIPATIISRVQRFNFGRIADDEITARLKFIIDSENSGDGDKIECEDDALVLIVRAARGGMRDAITILDKAISLSHKITVQTVTEVLGAVDYNVMSFIFSHLIYGASDKFYPAIVESVGEVYNSGINMKHFVSMMVEFCVNLIVHYQTGGNDSLSSVPRYVIENCDFSAVHPELISLLECLTKLESEIKWASDPKTVILANFIMFGNRGK